MEIKIPYTPHSKQREIHESKARFKVVPAGRRAGKTVLAINELIRVALTHPQGNGPIPRSWFVCGTYRQAEMVGWRTLLKYLPEETIAHKHGAKLQVELINGHVIEFKGAEDPDRLRGVALQFVVLDEYGLMAPEVWTDVLRPMLVDAGGGALFIGTPGADGSPHFQELYNLGKGIDPAYKSWLFFTTDNPAIPREEILEAKRNLPPDIFKREFEADFDVTAGLIYDNFKHSLHVIPNYEPTPRDFVVGSIDPGLQNPTAAILCAWDQYGVGRIFKEYYKKDLLASENAIKIKLLSRPSAEGASYKVSYWVIDRSSQKRDMTNGLSVYGKFKEYLSPLLPAPNDPGSVWAGIDEVKKLFQPDPKTGRPKLYISALCDRTLWEIGRYIRYKRKWHIDRNEEEKPRKLNDHLMDCIRNMVYTKPWIRPSIRAFEPSYARY